MLTINARKLVRKIWGSSVMAIPPRPVTRLRLETLEDRTLPSASPTDPQPINATAPSQAASAAEAITSYLFTMMEQSIATIEQDWSNAWYVLGQVIAQDAAALEEQEASFFGINLGASNPSSSGSGSGAATTAHNYPNQSPATTTLGSGSGMGMGGGSCTYYQRVVEFDQYQPVDVSEEAGMCTPNSVTLGVKVVNPNSMCPQISVDYATQDGSATAGTDYTAVNGTLYFAPGQSSDDYITIPILDDGGDESVGSQTFYVNLSNPVNAILGSPSTVTVNVDEAGQQQAATDTLRWNPCMGNNASTVQNWYDVTQGFQLQAGALGPNPPSPIQFDANPADTPNSNAPITWDQNLTVASISLSQYTGKQTINTGFIVETTGANGTALSMDGSSNLYLSYGAAAFFKIDNNATITNMNLTGDNSGTFEITAGTTTIAQSSSYSDTIGVKFKIDAGATLNDQGYTSLALTSSSIGFTVVGEMDVWYGTGDGITLIDGGGLADNYILVSGGTLKYLGSGNTTIDSFSVPVTVSNGGTFRVSVASGQPDGGTLIVSSVNMTGSSSTVQLAFGDTLRCDNGYSQTDGTLETTDNSTCTLKVGATGQGNATISGGSVWVDLYPNEYGTLNVKGNMGMAGQLGVSIQGYAPTGNPGTSDVLDVFGTLTLSQRNATLYVNDYGTLQKTATNTDFWNVIVSNNNIGGDFSSESSTPATNLNYGPPNDPDATKYRITYAG